MIWGSFLNMLSYRLISGDSLCIPRSFCPNCKKNILWHDNLPIISWLMLKGSCRFCHKPISALYPFIELLTVFIMLALIALVPPQYIFGYFIFCSALIVTIRSDLATMLISRYATLFMIPIAVILAYCNLIPLTVTQSIAGALSGYLFLWSIAKLFAVIAKKEGMGEGDMDLIALIGAFTGIAGWWISLLIGSCIGSIIGIALIAVQKNDRSTQIPFGPFLAAGAITYVLCNQLLHSLLHI